MLQIEFVYGEFELRTNSGDNDLLCCTATVSSDLNRKIVFPGKNFMDAEQRKLKQCPFSYIEDTNEID